MSSEPSARTRDQVLGRELQVQRLCGGWRLEEQKDATDKNKQKWLGRWFSW